MKIIKGNDVELSKPNFAPYREQPVELSVLLKHKMGKDFVVESVSSSDKVVGAKINSLVGSANLAFAGHKRLILSPDMIWTNILQQLAIHVGENPEKLRKKFVAFDGKAPLIVQRDSFVKGAQNPWEDTFPEFTGKAKEYIGEKNYNLLLPSFSTTTVTTKAVMEVAVMDVLQSYFDYGCRTMCGIPEFGLEGTHDDWQWILDNAKKLEKFEMDWWLKEALIPTLEEFVKAFDGDPNPSFWESFFKEGGGSGGPYINGYINTLFAYTVGYQNKFKKATSWPKGLTSNCFSGWTSNVYPSGVSSVPFTWNYFGTMFDMRFYSGFIGIVAEGDNVRPNLAWAIAENKAEEKSESFNRMSKADWGQIGIGESEYLGAFPVRQDITVLPKKKS